ncbi:MAG: LysM peptidoglycan-binding domain-containing protein, partial [Oscillospiraceae bacterium]
PVIKIGVGLSIGISRSFDFGIVKGGVSLTLVGIFEGTFAIFRPKNETLPEAFYYKARAVVGISGSLFLSVDFKIIAISASAYIQAFCELELESFKESHITLTLDLELSASIKILFFKIEFSFHFNHKASFSFGNNSDTPWQLQNKNANIVLAYPPIQINPDILLGKWSISPIISPMFSVLNPDAVVLDYCMAFPLIINHSDMYSVSELLLKWVLSHISGEFVTYQAAEEIKKADFSAALDYTGLINLLSKNLTVSPKFKFKNANDEIDEGFIFPMLPQLALQVNDLKINYGENYVTESDMELISEYFYRLNADPMYEFSKKSNAIDKSIPLCAAVLTDWFKMALSELTGNIGALFSSITVNTNSLTDVIARYQVESENILLDNPEAIINVSTIPEYEYTVSDGDSLKSIQAKFKLSYNELWNAVSDLSLQKTSIDIFYNDYSFNNNVSKLTVLQASAMFFVRLYNPDTVYTPYAEFILNNNSVSIDWECNSMKELTLSLPYGSYISLAGDTVIRIAKMLCLINNIYAESDWLNFKSSFISENGGNESSVLDSYKIANPQVLTRYTVKGYTNCSSLFRMCYPDLGLDYSNCELWNSEILKPLSVIPLNNIVVSDNGKISDMSMKYGEKSLAAAINQGTAVLANTTALIISMPYQISKTELCEHIISDKNISKIGAILSRGFFQGARPPAPSAKIETPLYELLQQQIKNINTNIDYKFSVENNEKTAAWIIAPPDEVTLTAVQLSSMLPTGNLNKPQLTELINPLHSQPKCWSLSSNKEIINSRFNGKIITLPKDCIEYIAFYNS